MGFEEMADCVVLRIAGKWTFSTLKQLWLRVKNTVQEPHSFFFVDTVGFVEMTLCVKLPLAGKWTFFTLKQFWLRVNFFDVTLQ